MRDTRILCVCLALAYTIPIALSAPYIMLYADAACHVPEFALLWNSTCSEIEDSADVCMSVGNETASMYGTFFCASSDDEIQGRFAKGTKLVMAGIHTEKLACTEEPVRGTSVSVADGVCHIYQSNASYIAQVYGNGSYHRRTYGGTKCRGRVRNEVLFPFESEELCIPSDGADFEWHQLVGTGEVSMTPSSASNSSSPTNTTATSKPATTPSYSSPAGNDEATVSAPATEPQTPAGTPISSSASSTSLHWAITSLLAVVTIVE